MRPYLRIVRTPTANPSAPDRKPHHLYSRSTQSFALHTFTPRDV